MALAILLVQAAPALPVDGGGASRFIVAFHELPAGLDTDGTYGGGRVVRTDVALRFAVVHTEDPARLELEARTDPNVRYVEEDGLMYATFTPNDPRYLEQYGPQHVQAPAAWDETLGTTDAAVCIIDTGVRYTHEDLTGTRWLGGHDYVNLDTDPWDDQGHGTHVAGIAAAGIDNGKGIAGVANVGIYGVKVLGSSGSGSFSNVASGIRWCADETIPTTVLSLSLGGSAALVVEDAVAYAESRGRLIVGAAGNDGCQPCVIYPAAYEEVIAVGCTDSTDDVCYFSSGGPQLELAAPGYDILATCYSSNTAYCRKSGTSMSTPHVSGAAALLWSSGPTVTAADLRQALRDTATDLGPTGHDWTFGYGLVNTAAAGAALNQPPIADAGPDIELTDGDGDGAITFILDGTRSHDPYGSIVSYEWSEGGTAVGTDASLTLTRALGAYAFLLTVTDRQGLTGTDLVDVILLPNAPPVVSAGPDIDRFDGDGDDSEPFTVAGTAVDTDGQLTTVEWLEGTEVLATGTTLPLARTVGTYVFTLRAVDNLAAETTDSATVRIHPNRAPTASWNVACKRGACTFDASASNDPDALPLQYAWSLGDGASSDLGPVLGHTFLDEGIFTVCLTVRDAGGLTGTNCRPVSISLLARILDDRNADVPALLGGNANALDIASVDARYSPTLGFLAQVRLNGLQSTTHQLTEGAVGGVYRVGWRTGADIEVLEYVRDPVLGEACRHARLPLSQADTLAGSPWILGPATCKVTLGGGGTVSLSLTAAQTDALGWTGATVLDGVHATTHAYRGTPSQAGPSAGALQRYDWTEAVQLTLGPSASLTRTPLRIQFDDSDEDFRKAYDHERGEVAWDPATKRIEIVSDRQATRNERLERPIQDPLRSGRDTFQIGGEWRVIVRGNLQTAFPLYLASGDPGAALNGARNAVVFRYDSGGPDAWLRQQFIDASGNQLLYAEKKVTGTSAFRVGIEYDAAQHHLTIRSFTLTGTLLMESAATLPAGTTFAFDRMGVATRGYDDNTFFDGFLPLRNVGNADAIALDAWRPWD